MTRTTAPLTTRFLYCDESSDGSLNTGSCSGPCFLRPTSKAESPVLAMIGSMSTPVLNADSLMGPPPAATASGDAGMGLRRYGRWPLALTCRRTGVV